MRGKSFLAMALFGVMALSGCLGFGEEDPDAADECEGLEGDALEACTHDHDDHDHGEGNETGNESVEPNVPPVASLTMTDSAGNALSNGSAIFVGQNVTFSANGSMDPDGQLELAALTVFDKNGTRTVSLIEDGQLVDVSLAFETNGFLVATLRVLDNDGEPASAADYAWVNMVQSKSGELALPAPPAQEVTGDCMGAGESSGAGSVLDGQYSTRETFQTFNGTRWISAVVTEGAGDVEITICSPDGDELSGTGSDVSTEDTGFAAAVDYYVFVVATGPQASYTVDIVAHFEPKPAE